LLYNESSSGDCSGYYNIGDRPVIQLQNGLLRTQDGTICRSAAVFCYVRLRSLRRTRPWYILPVLEKIQGWVKAKRRPILSLGFEPFDAMGLAAPSYHPLTCVGFIVRR